MKPSALDRSPSRIVRLRPDITLCQNDLPLDWYQEEFRPYAEEFLALPDREPATIIRWMDRYVRPAQEHFGESLLLLAHFYMGGEIVKLVEHYGGRVADSYQLALQARDHPEKRVIVESAVHFMAEAIAILAGDDQDVWITNPKAGCTLEMQAKAPMVIPVAEQLIERYGDDLVVIAYMNTSGHLKALAGRTGGAVCTSSNAHLLIARALEQGKKILFVPDRHLGLNTAHRLGIDPARVVTLPGPRPGASRFDGDGIPGGWTALDDASLILWRSECGVHTVFTADAVRAWQEKGWTVLVHPECPLEAVIEADGSGSTGYLWNEVMRAPAGSRIAIGTEGHFVRNLREQAAPRDVRVCHLADIPGLSPAGCGCAMMSRNDPPHLAGMLDLLRRGTPPEINRVLAGDTIDEVTMRRQRLDPAERARLIRDARLAMTRMIEITEASTG